MATAAKPRATFICATCHLTTDTRLAVDYKPHRGAPIRICAMCESRIIGYGEAPALEAIDRISRDRESLLVQANLLQTEVLP